MALRLVKVTGRSRRKWAEISIGCERVPKISKLLKCCSSEQNKTACVTETLGTHFGSEVKTQVEVQEGVLDRPGGGVRTV